MSRIPHDSLSNRTTLIDYRTQGELVVTAQTSIGACALFAERHQRGSFFKVGEQRWDGFLPHILAPRVAGTNEAERLPLLVRSLPRPEPFDDDCSLLPGTFT